MLDTPDTRKSLTAQLREFFYAEEVPYGLALLRITLPLLLLLTIVTRWPYAREMYSADGATAHLTQGYELGDVLPEFPGAVAVGLLTLLVVTLLMSAAGWYTRFSLLVSAVLYTYFTLIDAVGTMTKYSVIATHLMLILACSSCGSILSIDAWRRKRTDGATPPEPAPLWPRRLVQLLVGIVYLGAAVTKMQSPTFFTGDQMVSSMLTNLNYGHGLGEYLSLYPAISIISAYITIIWETLFLFIAWRGRSRVCMLALGVLFHAMTFFLLGLIVFPIMFCLLYFTFFSQQEYEGFGHRVQRLFGSPLSAVARLGNAAAARVTGLPLPSAAAYGLIALAAVMLGIEVEHRLDPYGLRRPEGRHVLQPLPQETAHRMLTEDKQLREKDKFFAFDIGTTVLGGALANRRESFVVGEDLIAQCILNPPHEDMWVECNLHDASGQIIDLSSACVPRETVRSTFTFELDDRLPAGHYYLSLKSRGQQIARRDFELRPTGGQRVTAPVGN